MKPIGSFDELARSLVNAERLVGMDKLPVPGKDSPKEAWDTVYARLGRPENPDGYELAKIEGNPTYDAAMEPSFREVAHKAGLNNAQVAELQKWYAETGATKAQQIEAQLAADDEAAMAEISKEWGAAFDERSAIAKRGAREMGGQDLLDALEAGLGGAALMRIAYKVGSLTGEDSGLIGSGRGGFIKTPDQAKAEITAKQRDEAFMKLYNDGSAPGHKEAVAEMRALYKLANPEQQ